MGERDLSGTVRRRSWILTPVLMPAALLLFLFVLHLARPAEAPSSPRGIALVLHAESLLNDQNASFEEEDLERLRQLPQSESLSVLLKEHPDGRATYPDSSLLALWLLPFVALGGLSGAVFAAALAVACAMGLAASTMKRQLHTPWGILLICLLASVAVRFVLEPRPEALVLAAVLAAFAIAYRGEPARYVEMPEVFDEASRSGGRGFGSRWAVVGLLLAVAVVYHPIYVLLLVPAGLAVPIAARRAGVAWMIAAVVVVALPALIVPGLAGELRWQQEAEVFSTSTGFPDLGAEWGDGEAVPSLSSAARPQLNAGLNAWNALFVVAGQSAGALPYFLPLLLLLALWEPRSGRSPLVVAAGAMAAVSVVVWPFDWPGGAGVLGNALLLPAFGALWLVPTRPVRAVWLVVVTVLGGVFLWPTWQEAIGLRSTLGRPIDAASPVAVRWLPLESTRRVGEDDLVREGSMAMRVVGGAATTRAGQLVLEGGAWGDLLLIAPQAVESVVFEFDGQAGTDLELTGATVGNTVFRADGGVAFEVELGKGRRRHPMWWSPRPQSLYDLHLRLPNAPPYPVAFRVRPLDDGSS